MSTRTLLVTLCGLSFACLFLTLRVVGGGICMTLWLLDVHTMKPADYAASARWVWLLPTAQACLTPQWDARVGRIECDASVNVTPQFPEKPRFPDLRERDENLTENERMLWIDNRRWKLEEYDAQLATYRAEEEKVRATLIYPPSHPFIFFQKYASPEEQVRFFIWYHGRHVDSEWAARVRRMSADTRHRLLHSYSALLETVETFVPRRGRPSMANRIENVFARASLQWSQYHPVPYAWVLWTLTACTVPVMVLQAMWAVEILKGVFFLWSTGGVPDVDTG